LGKFLRGRRERLLLPAGGGDVLWAADRDHVLRVGAPFGALRRLRGVGDLHGLFGADDDNNDVVDGDDLEHDDVDGVAV